MKLRWVALAIAVAACGDPASDGPPTLGSADTTVDANGCIAISTGHDTDHDGALGDDEIEDTSKLCGPVDGSTVHCDTSGDGGKAVTGPISLASADDLAKLADVTCIDGDLLIVGLDDPDLPLGTIHTVTGNVAVAGDPNLTTLGALAQLHAIGGALLVQGNDALVDLDGAAAIPALPELDVLANAHLPDLSGLEAFGCSTTLRVADNPELASLTGLDGHTCIGELALDGNASLDSLDALAQLTTAGGLELASNPRLSTIQLPKLATVTGELRVADEGIRELALPVLVSVGSLDVSGDALVTSVDLPQLASADSITLANDRELAAVRAAVSAPHDVALSALPALSALSLGAITALDGDLTIEHTDLPTLADFALLSRIGGDLTLTDNAFGVRAARAFAARLQIDGAKTID